MQTFKLSEQDSDQRQSQMSVGNHVGNLWVGILLGLWLMLLDRRNQRPGVSHPKQARSWQQTGLLYLGIGLALFVIANLLMGP
jgi:hypothetical protein